MSDETEQADVDACAATCVKSSEVTPHGLAYRAYDGWTSVRLNFISSAAATPPAQQVSMRQPRRQDDFTNR